MDFIAFEAFVAFVIIIAFIVTVAFITFIKVTFVTVRIRASSLHFSSYMVNYSSSLD